MRVANAQSLKFQIGKGVSDSLAFIEQGYGNLLTLTQIENYLSCALQLKLPKEYRYWLRLYARRLSDETALAKIEELCYLLLGPSHL
jgi:protein HIRA/HIR1